MARSRSKKQKSPSISGTDWATLDFGQIEKALAAKLSDEDVRDVLVHINAANKLKKLSLTNCTNITGAGLSPLSGSTTIEHLDLSVVEKFQSPELFPKPRISCETVLPILDSIISNEVLCKLKHLHFHRSWRLMAWRGREHTDTINGSSTGSDLHAFILRYNQMLEERGQVCCLKCNEEVTEQYNQPKIPLDNHLDSFCTYYGTQENFCHQCSNYVCWSCLPEDVIAGHYFCSACEREYCENCVTIAECKICEGFFCADSCLTHSCANCDEKVCGGCKVSSACVKCNRIWCATDECYQYCPACECCDKTCCIECSKEDKANEVFYCGDCRCGYACSSCLLDEIQQGDIDCQSCIKRVTPLIKQLKDENEELKDENRDLKNANEYLKDANESMRKRIQDLEESKK